MNMKNDTLIESGLKNTKPRRLILNILSKSSLPLTAEDIYFSLKKEGVNLSTVYRTLNSFEKAHIVKKEINQNKENSFILLEHDDHHVLVCLKCHKVVPLEGCPYHEANEELENKTGFAIQDHNIEIYGVCPNCQKR